MTSNQIARIRVLIVDDEPIARTRIRTALQKFASVIDTIEEASDGAHAVSMIEQQAPHLIFLDVQMPELDGVGVVRQVGMQSMPLTIFVTAHEEYALAAFDLAALDYLLKPFDQPRFEQAVHRAIARLRSPSAPTSVNREQLRVLLFHFARPPLVERVIVKINGRRLVIPTKDIDWIEAANNNLRLHVGTTIHQTRGKLSAIERRLNPDVFLRVHRSSIVNLQRVHEVQPWFRGDMVALLAAGGKVMVSRRYRDALLTRLGMELG